MYVLIFHPRMNNPNPFSSFSDVGKEPFHLSEGSLSGCRKGRVPKVGIVMVAIRESFTGAVRESFTGVVREPLRVL